MNSKKYPDIYISDDHEWGGFCDSCDAWMELGDLGLSLKLPKSYINSYIGICRYCMEEIVSAWNNALIKEKLCQDKD